MPLWADVTEMKRQGSDTKLNLVNVNCIIVLNIENTWDINRGDIYNLNPSRIL